VAIDQLVQARGALGRGGGERLGERRRIVRQGLGDRPTGEIVLVDGDDRGPALLGASYLSRPSWRERRR
jgi:hypothetical protein